MIWTFVNDHPYLTVFVIYLICDTIVRCVYSVMGTVELDDYDDDEIKVEL